MAKRKPAMPDPVKIARQIDDIYAIRGFCGDMLEDVNDHWIAHAIWSMNLGDVDLACAFLRLSHERDQAGSLTTELHQRANELVTRYSEAVRSMRERESA